MSKTPCCRPSKVTAILVVALFWTSVSVIAQERVIHNFGNGGDGRNPYNSLIIDAAGNLYGTTTYGGVGGGTVFELMRQAGGGWKERILHEFFEVGGQWPEGNLIFDTVGNLYGTATYGGTHGFGVAFEFSPAAGGGWKEEVLHDFNDNQIDGANPFAGLIFDAAGNLYGTTQLGGGADEGAVFELSPSTGGAWTETTLHSFRKSVDGISPSCSLTFDSAGNLYGVTYGAKGYYYGTVFELTPQAGGGWTAEVLHTFGNGTDGRYPYAGLIFDSAGNLYGTTKRGGDNGAGTVFELSRNSAGTWDEQILHSFDNNDGSAPFGGVIFDASGNLYGTTFAGGSCDRCGTAFELTPGSGGVWTERVLHYFKENGTDGYGPDGSLVFDQSGNLYGTTSLGGAYDGGTVFEMRP